MWLLMLPFALMVGCTSAKITNTWRDPTFAGPIQFKKIAILVIHPDGAVRRAAEDELVKQIGHDRAVAGYSILTDDDRKDLNQLKRKLKANDIDGAVTMKLAGSRTETTYVPGSAGYPPFGDYYTAAYMRDPGMVVTDTIVSVQTNIYSVNDEKLIWSGTTDLYNPSNARKVVADISKAVGDELRKEKLIQ